MIRLRRFFLFIGDILSIVAAYALMVIVRSGIGKGQIPFTKVAFPLLMILVLWLLMLFIFNLYEIKYINPSPRNIGLLAIAMTLNILLGSLVFYFFPKDGITPKLSLLFAGAAAFVLLIIWRRFFYTFFSTLSIRSIFIVGNGPAIAHFASELHANPLLGKVAFETESADENILRAAEDKFGKPDIMVSETKDLQKLTKVAETLETRIISIEEAYEEIFAKIPISLMSEESAMRMLSRAQSLSYSFFKSALSKIFALLILITTSPISLLIILLTLAETGRPIIYNNKRVGKNGKTFNLYKFRSMHVLNADGSAEKDGAVWAEINDPRITRVGRITRVLHVDEIPQMINVLKGDLTLVGPRAERPEFVASLEKEIPYYYLRHIITPGFTGWAQIKFRYARSVDDSEKKFEYDLFYIKNRNIFLDTGIILKTVQIIFSH